MKKHGTVKFNDVEKRVFEIFKNVPIFLVGGSVRDKIIGRESKDYDFATPLLSDEISSILKSNGYKCDLVGAKFGVVIANMCHEHVEITTFRKHEKYEGSRFPTVEFGTTLESDINRRDFTCNSLAVDRNHEIISYNSGYDDIKRGILRTPVDPEITFREDPLRMLRAVRFGSQLAGFRLHDSVYWAIKSYNYLISTISNERWKMEMDKLLMGYEADWGIRILVNTGLARYILPELYNIVNMPQPEEYHHKDVFNHTIMTVNNVKNDVNLKWTMLLHDLGKAYTRSCNDGQIHFYRHEVISKLIAEGILDRFRFSTSDKNRILFLIENHMRIMQSNDKWRDKTVRKLATDSGEYLYDLLEVSKADITSSRPERVQRGIDKVKLLEDRIEDLKSKDNLVPMLPKGIGNYIMVICDIGPGKLVGEIKRHLEEGIIMGALDSGMPTDYYEGAIIKIFDIIKTVLTKHKKEIENG